MVRRVSYITDVVVHVAYAPKDVHAALTQPLAWDDRAPSLAKIDMERAGGSKVFTDDVYAGAFNYLDADAFVAWFAGLPWSTAGDASASLSAESGYRYFVVIVGGKVRLRADVAEGLYGDGPNIRALTP